MTIFRFCYIDLCLWIEFNQNFPSDLLHHPPILKSTFSLAIEFLTVYTKLAEMALLASKFYQKQKRTRPYARDYNWFKSPMPNQLS